MKVLTMHSLTEAGRIAPESVELNLSERDASAVISMDIAGNSLAVGQWLQDTTEPGAGILWRVRAVDTSYDTDTVRVTLEHMIRSLADYIIPNEVKATDISGSASCTARAAITYVLGRQSDWTLGDFDYDSVSNPYSFSGDTLLAAVETVSASLEDPVWTYDFSVYPFRLNITRKSSTPACEMRAGRNITTMRTQVDKSRMYTRLYPVGFKNLKLAPLAYVSRNENVWGVIEKTETDQGKKTDAELRAWATARLNNHCTPLVTVSISGFDLSEATGEPMDRLTVGRTCRVPLPAYGVTMLETITKLTWRDKLKDPESVTVTLANDPADVQSILSQQASSGGHSARMSAEVDEDNSLIIGSVESGLYTRIAQTASELRREAHNEAEGLRTYVIQTASEIRQEAQNDAASLRSLVSQTASSWAAMISGVTDSSGRVTAASIGAKISESGSNAWIGADHVRITGDTTLDGLLRVSGSVISIDVGAGQISANSMDVTTILTAESIEATSQVSAGGFQSNVYEMDDYDGNLADSIKAVQIVQVSGTSDYKLQYKTFSGDAWTDAGTFSRATTTRTVSRLTHRGGTVHVGSKVYTVTADVTYDDSSTGVSTIAIPLTVGSYVPGTKEYPVTVAGINGISVNAGAAWTAGYDDAWDDTQIWSLSAGTISKVTTSSGVRRKCAMSATIGDVQGDDFDDPGVLPSATHAGVSYNLDVSGIWDACYNTLDTSGMPSSQTITAGSSITVTVKLDKASGTQTISRTYTAESASHDASASSDGGNWVYSSLSALRATLPSGASLGSLGNISSGQFMKIKVSCGTSEKYYYVHGA